MTPQHDTSRDGRGNGNTVLETRISARDACFVAKASLLAPEKIKAMEVRTVRSKRTTASPSQRVGQGFDRSFGDLWTALGEVK
jgi:hypothetical protein